MKGYRQKHWQAFRQEVIDLDGGLCTVCHRGVPDVYLQVHHKRYIPNKMPWQYAYKDCVTLCKGCHAAEHGIIPPKVGWQYLGHVDLGDRIGECQLCGSSLRHHFFVFHKNWGTMQVGTYCSNSLTDSELASNCVESKKRFEDRQTRFIQSTRWQHKNAVYSITQQKIKIEIIPVNGSFHIKMNGCIGHLQFNSLLSAKIKTFEVIENGRATKYLESMQT